MSIEITEEEYNEALIHKERLMNKLFKLRLELLDSNEVNKSNLITEEIKLVKRELGKYLLITERYRIANLIKERGKNL